MPFNYNPNDYKPQYGFIAVGASTLGQGIGTAVDQKIAYQRELDKAAKIAEKNRANLDMAYKTVKNITLRKIQTLQELGAIPKDENGQREVNAILKAATIKPGGEMDLREYIALADKAATSVNADLDRRIAEINTKKQQAAIGTAVSSAMKGNPEQITPPQMQMQSGSNVLPENPENPWGDNETPAAQAQPTITPARPAATTTHDVAMNIPQDISYQQLQTDPKFRTMQDQERNQYKEKELKIKADRLDHDKNKEQRLENNDALKWARLNLDTQKFEFAMGSKVGRDLDLAAQAVSDADVNLAKYEGEGVKLLEDIADLEQQLESGIATADPEQGQMLNKNLEKLKAEARKNDLMISSLREKKLKAEREENTATDVFKKYLEKMANQKNASGYTGAVAGAEADKNKPVIPGPRPVQSPAPKPIGTQPPPTQPPAQQPPARPVINVPNVTGKPVSGSTGNDIRTMSDAEIKKMVEAKVAEWRTKTNNEALIQAQLKKLMGRIAQIRSTK